MGDRGTFPSAGVRRFHLFVALLAGPVGPGSPVHADPVPNPSPSDPHEQPPDLVREMGFSSSGDSTTIEERIRHWIEDLGRRDYAVRTEATRQLCKAGAVIRPVLREASTSPNAEIALRVQRILRTFDQMWFAGLRVELQFEPAEASWDESVDLMVRLTNDTPDAVRIPLGPDSPGDPPARSPEARQIGLMLDFADWLTVRSSTSATIALRVDDVSVSPEMSEVVDGRARETLEGLVESGARRTYRIPAFNRGWARYPLLDRDDYIVQFHYQPPWDDDVLVEQRVGLVTSNDARLSIRTSAPGLVSRSGEGAHLVLRQADDDLVVWMVNRHDQTISVIRQFGDAQPLARGVWNFQIGEAVHELPILPAPRAPDQACDDVPHWDEVLPGREVELVRVRVDDLRQAFKRVGAPVESDRWKLTFQYSNVYDARWQRQQRAGFDDPDDVPPVLRVPLPLRLLSARLVSNPLNAPRAGA